MSVNNFIYEFVVQKRGLSNRQKFEKDSTFHENEEQPKSMKREGKRTWDILLTNSNVQVEEKSLKKMQKWPEK